MIINRALLAACLPAVSDDPSRYALNALQIEPSGKVVATNGHVLITASQSEPFPDAEFPIVPGAEYHGDPTAPVLLPADMAVRLLKTAATKSRLPILSTVQVARNGSDHTATIAATDLEMPTIAKVKTTEHPESSQFPTYDRVFPTQGETVGVIFAVDVLETLIKAAKAVSGKRATLTLQIPIDAHGRDVIRGKDDEPTGELGNATGPIVFDVKGIDGITVHGVAMPMRR